jgi:predicted transglutaminase-like cysteine proteinase
LIDRRQSAPRRRRRAAWILITATLLTLSPKTIALQDLGALLAREPAMVERWHKHLIGSPFGTIHAATFNLLSPLGTTIPRAPFDLTDLNQDPPGRQLPGNQSETRKFPTPDRHAKSDSFISREREPMPALGAIVPKVLPAAFNTPVLAPVAFARFCDRYPDDCKVDPMDFDRAVFSLTKAHLTELSQVNREVNESIRPKHNFAGVLEEQWLVAPHQGDCNDYAVTKRHELLSRGWPAQSLLLAEVIVPSGEHHLVLVVRTHETDLVLDNLNWNIRPVAQTGYRFVRAQQTNNPRFWSTFDSRLAINFR